MSIVVKISGLLDLKLPPGDDSEDHIIRCFSEDQTLFMSFLYKVFDTKVRAILEQEGGVKDFKDKASIRSVSPYKRDITLTRKITAITRLKFSPLTYSRVELIVMRILIGVAVLCGVIIMIGVEENMDVDGYSGRKNTMDLIRVGAILILIVGVVIVSVVGLVTSFKRRWFAPRIVTYHDLIMDLVLANRGSFMKNNFRLAKKELRRCLAYL